MKRNTITDYFHQNWRVKIERYHAKNEIGIVCSFPQEPTDTYFYFLIYDDVDVKSGEYVEVAAGNYVIIGKISKICVYDELFKDLNFVQTQINAPISYCALLPPRLTQKRIAYVIIIGVLESNKILPPSIPPEPGERVFLAKNESLRKVLDLPSDGIFIGTLINRPDIRVFLDPEKLLSFHFAIFGTTGTGKSYTAGVIIEEFLERNIPILVIDPHGEYEKMSEPNTNASDIRELRKYDLAPKGYPIRVFKPYYQNTGDLSLSFDMLDFDALSELARVTETMRDLLFLVLKELKREGKAFDLNTIAETIDRVASKWNFSFKTRVALKRNIEVLNELGIFDSGFDVTELIKPGQLTIINVSEDMPEYVRKIFIGVLLKEIFKARKNKRIPRTLIVIDECHRFISSEDRDSFTLNSIRKIAREGRKFGIGLGIISQRIVGLDKTVVSQCRTKIILRLDMYTDIDQLAPYFTDEKIRQKIMCLPDGTAYIVGAATRFPILVKIRPRKSNYVKFF